MPNSWLVVLFLADNDVSADARGVTWNSLPQEIQLVRKCLLLQLTQRFAPNGSSESSSLIWTRAALCHPKGKMLNWLSQQSRDAAIADFRALVLQYSLVADPAPAASAAATHAPISKPSWLEWDDQIPVRRTESCPHSSQGQPGDNIDPVESELTEWFQFQSPRAVGVKDTLLWWHRCPDTGASMRDKFPRIWRVARVYLAMPATNASSERVFSTTNVIVKRQRWSMDPVKLSDLVLAKYNSSWWPSVFKNVAPSVDSGESADFGSDDMHADVDDDDAWNALQE
jgi:hypothetical protein